MVLAFGWGCDKKSSTEGSAVPSEPAPVKAEPTIELPATPTAPEVGGGNVGVKLPQAAVADPADQTAATRCTVDVELPAAECGERTLGSIAVSGGKLYVALRGDGVRRYTLGGDGDACALTLDKGFGVEGTLANPEVKPTGQKLDGPVYMRSGGPSYDLVLGPGDTVFMYDFLDGIHRVEGNKGFARCTGMSGIKAVAFAGKKVLAARGDDLYTVDAKCKMTSPWKMPLQPQALLASGGKLFASGSDKEGKNRVFELDAKGKKVWMAGNDDAFADDGLCWAGELADCGDAVCVVDGNCNKVSRFAKADGALAGGWKIRDLFGMDAYRIGGLAAAGDTLFAAVAMRDTKTDQCASAVFRFPSK